MHILYHFKIELMSLTIFWNCILFLIIFYVVITISGISSINILFVQYILSILKCNYTHFLGDRNWKELSVFYINEYQSEIFDNQNLKLSLSFKRIYMAWDLIIFYVYYIIYNLLYMHYNLNMLQVSLNYTYY